MNLIEKYEKWLQAKRRKQQLDLFNRGVNHVHNIIKQRQEAIQEAQLLLELTPAELQLENLGKYDEFAMGVREALKELDNDKMD